MANKVRKTRKPSRRSTRKLKKPSKARLVTTSARKRRVRRSSKATQVTGDEIDEAFEALTTKTVLERKVDEKVANDEETYSNIIISTNYEETSPFDPDEDVDDEPENRKKMYEVAPKARTPEGPGGVAVGATSRQKEPTTSKSRDEDKEVSGKQDKPVADYFN